MSDVKFPNVFVPLLGQDGNAFSIMGRVVSALRKAGHGDAVEDYTNDAMSGDYDHLLRVTMATVNIDTPDDYDEDSDDY